jgi:hypothetical protein
MRSAFSLVFLAILSSSSCLRQDSSMDFALNYDDMVLLDAESLAEGGIREAYEELLPKLRQYVKQPGTIDESLDDASPHYSVTYDTKEFVIYGPGLDEGEGQSWGRATNAFFAIVNAQLADSEYRFFAVHGGNDLGGMFLTPSQAEAARKGLPRKLDWPYLPNDEHPWHGQHR